MLTEFIGRNLIFLTEVESTNSYAMQLLKNVKPVEGTVVYTHHQTLGRGQRFKAWDSEPAANITMSTILYPDFLQLQNQAYLYQITALACYDTITAILDPSQYDINIKWPNDILVNKKKLCGILIENSLLESKLQSSILGVGLNVNQKKFPESILATSLSLLTGIDYELESLLFNLCNALSLRYESLRLGQLEKIQKEYLNYLFGMNVWRDFILNGNTLSLKVIGLSEHGLLLLEDKNHKRIQVDNQEIKWLF